MNAGVLSWLIFWLVMWLAFGAIISALVHHLRYKSTGHTYHLVPRKCDWESK